MKTRATQRGERVAPPLPLPLLRMFGRVLPTGRFSRSRARLLRACGFRGVSTKATLLDLPTIVGYDGPASRLTVGADSFINVECLFDLGASISIGESVYLAHRVMLITSSHEIGGSRQRAAAVTTDDIVIEPGAWLGAGVTVLPGVTIGAGAIVGAGSLVNIDVPDGALFAGVPARMIKKLPMD